MRPVASVLALLALLSVAPVRAEKAQADTIPYLGVATMPVDPMLARHLKLKPGAGLLVQFVDEKSAADGVLEPEDILTDLDGQILINPEQFVALVRMQKPGQELTLKLLRAGAEKTVKVKLGEREAQDEEQDFASPFADPRFDLFRFNHMRPDATVAPRSPRGRNELRPRRDDANTAIEMHSTAVIEENGLRAELTDDGKVRHFKVTDDDKVVYDGDVKGEGDVKKMPKAARELYERISGGTKIELKQVPDDQADPAGRVST